MRRLLAAILDWITDPSGMWYPKTLAWAVPAAILFVMILGDVGVIVMCLTMVIPAFFLRHTVITHYRSQLRRAQIGLCPVCNYDMRGRQLERCPECGKDARQWIEETRRDLDL